MLEANDKEKYKKDSSLNEKGERGDRDKRERNMRE